GIDKPIAYVVPAAGASVDPDELIAFARAGLAGFKRPRRVFVADGLPRTATGKLRRFAVRELAIARLAAEGPASAGAGPAHAEPANAEPAAEAALAGDPAAAAG